MLKFESYIFVVVAAVSILFACQTNQEFTSSPPDFEEVPDQESWNATVTSTTNGKVTSIIAYQYMQKFSKSGISKFSQGVEIELFDTDGARVSHVKAKRALYKELLRVIELNDSVHVQIDGGFELRTDKLTWDERKETIHTDAFVTVVTAEKDTIYGIGFDSKRPFQNWTIRKPRGVTQRRLNLGLNDSDAETKDK